MAEEAEKKGMPGWLKILLVLLAVVGVVLAALAIYFRRDIKTLAQARQLAVTARTFLQEEAPALERDFPFNPNQPPEMDRAWLVRFLQCRNALAPAMSQLDPLLQKLPDPRTLQNLNAQRVRQLALRVEPEMELLRDFMKTLAPTLRQHQLSLEAYAWAARNCWRGVAKSAQWGDNQALAYLEQIQQEYGPLLPSRAREASPRKMAEGLLETLPEGPGAYPPEHAWAALKPLWLEWTRESQAPAVDLILTGLARPEVREKLQALPF